MHGVTTSRSGTPVSQGPFAGFWMGGFEGADAVNAAGQPLDLVRDSGHLAQLEADHRRAAQAGLRCVRESIGWRISEDGGGHIDLSRAVRVQASARRHGLQVLWTLVHYGVPDDLSLHDDALAPRLARFAAEVARVLGPGSGPWPPVFTPINEISYLAWAASQPGHFQPGHGLGRAAAPEAEDSRISGYEIKRRLVVAALAAMAAIRRVLPEARFLHVEPMVHVVAPLSAPELAAEAAQVTSWQWQAWDLIAGRVEPQLGGGTAWLDLVGVNHYHSSQWELGTEARLDWAARDSRRRRLSALLCDAWQRYRRPLLLAETSHVGEGRATWLHEVAGEVKEARRQQVPVLGVCLYPVVDRPDWQAPEQWHRSGLWHVDSTRTDLPRRGDAEALAALRQWRQVLPQALPTDARGACRASAPRLLLAFIPQRWDALRCRARHLLEGLVAVAPGWRLAVVEPARPAVLPWLDTRSAGPRVDVLMPHSPVPALGAPLQTGPCLAMQKLLGRWLTAQGVQRPTVWLGTAQAASLAKGLLPSALIYDADADAAVRLPDPLASLAQALAAESDLVLVSSAAQAQHLSAAAGPCLLSVPDAVESRVFRVRQASSSTPAGWEAYEVVRLLAERGVGPGPQLGYAGVIDARVDLDLVIGMAEARPEWQFLMVGPVRGIELGPRTQRPNLHWLGAQPYRLLPALMARWQLALLPLAPQALAHRARPRQALEALAMGLPVVMPQHPEFVGWEATGVTVVGDEAQSRIDAFLEACDAALATPQLVRVAQRDAAHRALRSAGVSSWLRASRRLARWLHTPAEARALSAQSDIVCQTRAPLVACR